MERRHYVGIGVFLRAVLGYVLNRVGIGLGLGAFLGAIAFEISQQRKRE